MPSENRLAFFRASLRNHPVIVAGGAATIGVLLGGFVMAQVFAPAKPRVDSAPAQQVAAETKLPPKVAAKSAPETTGSAPSNESVASADCDKQTWPYLSQNCVTRGPRVVTSDKLNPKPAVAPAEAAPAPAPAAPSIAATTPTPAAPAPAIASVTPAAADPAPAPALAVPATAPVAATTFVPQSESAAKAEPKAKRAAKRVKRTPKAEVQTAVRQDSDDDGDRSVTSEESENRVTTRRESRRSGKPHIVARWIERVPADDDDRPVRVRRAGGLFESLFGLGGRPSQDDDDD